MALLQISSCHTLQRALGFEGNGTQQATYGVMEGVLSLEEDREGEIDQGGADPQEVREVVQQLGVEGIVVPLGQETLFPQ